MVPTWAYRYFIGRLTLKDLQETSIIHDALVQIGEFTYCMRLFVIIPVISAMHVITATARYAVRGHNNIEQTG